MSIFGCNIPTTLFFVVFGYLFTGFFSGSANGAQLEIAFDTNAADTPIQYYVLYWDTQSRKGVSNYANFIQIDYSECIELSDSSVVCSLDVPQLQQGIVYYFSMRNFYLSTESSGFADEFVLINSGPAGSATTDNDFDNDVDGLDLSAFAEQIEFGDTIFSVADFATMFGVGAK